MKAFRFIVVVSVSYLVVACGGSPSKTPVSEPLRTVPLVVDVESPDQSTLDSIKQDFDKTQNIEARNYALLRLANNYQQEGDCTSANIIVKHIEQNKNEASTRKGISTSVITNVNHDLANLLKVECSLQGHVSNAYSDYQEANPIPIALIQEWLSHIAFNSKDIADKRSLNPSGYLYENDRAFDLSTRTQIANAQIKAAQGNYELALVELLNDAYGEFGARLGDQDTVNPVSSVHHSMVWKWYSMTNIQGRERLVKAYPILRDYKLLLGTIEDQSINDAVRQTNIKRWLASSNNSVIMQNLPNQVEKYLAISNRENQKIAVLLPLSGRLSNQGEAIKQGMLSAYYQQLENAKKHNTHVQSTLEFLDTGSLSTLKDTITSESLASFDTIIGPLLRPHIEKVSQFDLSNKHQLRLNQVKTNTDSHNVVMATFSLSPEQEAKQLVALMRKQNIVNPVIINDGSVTTSRMNDAFIKAWQSSQAKSAPSLHQISYSDNKSMRVGITSALNVLQSQKRIRQLENISDERVYSVTRNRRDVDAFVVFARPNDVELINPIIESSISLFTTEQVPVFATSYSYDHKQSKNTQRDLRNLVFVDMPWLLPQHRTDKLATNVDTLFNEPPSAFLRLFAFGYDALTLVDNLAQLSTFEHLSVDGLTGTLSVNGHKELNRELSSLTINSKNTE